MLKERLNRGVLEYSKGLYRNLWFLVKKKKLGEYRLINLAIYLNIVIRRDANLLLSIDEFIDEFTGCYIASLVDLYSNYNQILLYPKSRDLMAFFILFRLLQNTMLLQGAINSVI
jgi:hypothetical protein